MCKVVGVDHEQLLSLTVAAGYLSEEDLDSFDRLTSVFRRHIIRSVKKTVLV